MQIVRTPFSTAMLKLLTPKRVGQALGVSEASIKRWCDRGKIPTTRTAGGHRRISVNAVVQYLREHDQPLVRPEILGLPPASGRGEKELRRSEEPLREALEVGDSERFRRLAFNLYLSGQRCCDVCDTTAEVFRSLGSRWRHGELEIYQERRACAICNAWIHESSFLLPSVPEGAPYALGGTLHGDPYELPTSMVELALREAGWRAESYGIGMPAETLCAAIVRERPRLFWLSVSAVESPAEFVTSFAQIHEAASGAGIAIIVGGRALTEEIRRQIQYSAYCDNFKHLRSFADTLRGASAP